MLKSEEVKAYKIWHEKKYPGEKVGLHWAKVKEWEDSIQQFKTFVPNEKGKAVGNESNRKR